MILVNGQDVLPTRTWYNFLKNMEQSVPYHPVVNQILDLLTHHSVWFETFEHEPVRTSEEAAKTRVDYTLAQGAKALIVRIKKISGEKEFVMLVVPGDKRFDEDKVSTLLRAKDIRFATEAEVHGITGGVQLGGVPPFGNLFQLTVIADETLLQNEKIVFNAGDRKFSIAMKSVDYQQLVQPRVESIITE